MDKSGVDQSRVDHVLPSGVNRLVLIDGNAILHRAYHALPPLTAPDGSLVNAVYGFTSILIKLFTDLKPTHLAVAFDRPEPTFRKELYKDYQAKRPEMEEGLSSQIPKVQDVVRAFGIPIYDAAGFEADDVIGTLAKQATDQHMIKEHEQHMKKSSCVHHVPQSRVDQTPMQVVIVSGDRDLLQLVKDDRILVFMPTKGLSEGKLFGQKDVEEKMGVAPDLIPDLKALMGDASDNYPGVTGIGPKTAIGLLATFKNVEALYKAIHGNDKRLQGVSEAIVLKLQDGIEAAKLSKDLATIRTNAPVDFDEEQAQIETLDTLNVRAKLAQYHFPSLIKRLAGGEAMPKETKKIKEKKPKEKQTEQQELF